MVCVWQGGGGRRVWGGGLLGPRLCLPLRGAAPIIPSTVGHVVHAPTWRVCSSWMRCWFSRSSPATRTDVTSWSVRYLTRIRRRLLSIICCFPFPISSFFSPSLPPADRATRIGLARAHMADTWARHFARLSYRHDPLREALLDAPGCACASRGCAPPCIDRGCVLGRCHSTMQDVRVCATFPTEPEARP